MTLVADVILKLRTPELTLQITLRKGTWYTGPSNFQISTTKPVPYFLINVKAVQLQKLSVSDMQNLKTVF